MGGRMRAREGDEGRPGSRTGLARVTALSNCPS